MTVDGSIQDNQVDDYDPADIEGLPEHANLGAGIEEWNVPFESDVREILEHAADEGDRVTITAFDGENFQSIEFFDRGMSADYLVDQLDSTGMSIGEYLASQSEGLLDAENIEFFQIHESANSHDLAFE